MKNLIHMNAFIETGADLTIQNAYPSVLMEGNVNLAVIAVRTNAASPIFRKERIF